jgi:glycosyltransferase involved in cell wall biosynthesis
MTNKRIIIIAQTPPPFHGQAIMQQHLVNANWKWCKKQFVRMNFSEEIDEVGVLKLKKLWQLFRLINRVLKKAKPKPELIYYPPAGPHRIPIYRDVILLFFLKMISRKIILHFHAGAVDQIFNKVTKIEALIIKKAFKNVDAVIVLTEWLKKEVGWCKPKKFFVVANGIEDVFESFFPKAKQNNLISFLFVGNLKKEKGIFTLLNAAIILKDRGEKFEIKFVGSFHKAEENQIFFRVISENGLTDYVKYLGTKTGNDKWREFATSDVLCLPTYENEAMPISILEAMMFQMPVITTRWRSIPDVIRHEDNGLLFEPENAEQLAACMQKLICVEKDRKQMGVQARKDYLRNFTVNQHLENMEKTFQEVLTL